LNQNNLLGPILFRFVFFAINLFFTIRITSFGGWNFFTIILAFFATRDLVHGVRLAQVYYHIKKHSNSDSDNDQNEQ